MDSVKNLIAYCGLDCGTCDARKATLTNDGALREKVARLWSELNGADITSEMIRCEGCRADGVKTPYCESLCPIRQCARGKAVETCGGCPAMDGCQTVGMVLLNNPEAAENLKNSR